MMLKEYTKLEKCNTSKKGKFSGLVEELN